MLDGNGPSISWVGVKRDGMNRKDINFWLLPGNLLDEEKGVLIDRRARG